MPQWLIVNDRPFSGKRTRHAYRADIIIRVWVDDSYLADDVSTHRLSFRMTDGTVGTFMSYQGTRELADNTLAVVVRTLCSKHEVVEITISEKTKGVIEVHVRATSGDDPALLDTDTKVIKEKIKK